MSFFKSWRSHYTAGFLYGLTLRSRPTADRRTVIAKLDVWAWNREWKQNLKADHPNVTLSAKQLREGMAWGAGARAAAGVEAPYPSPPYEAGVKWGNHA